MNTSPPGSSVHGVLWARILEWVAISFCRGSTRPRGWTLVSCIEVMVWPQHHSLRMNRLDLYGKAWGPSDVGISLPHETIFFLGHFQHAVYCHEHPRVDGPVVPRRWKNNCQLKGVIMPFPLRSLCMSSFRATQYWTWKASLVVRLSSWVPNNSHHGKLFEGQSNPAISLLGIYLEKTITQKDICNSKRYKKIHAPVFTAALFTIAKMHKCPLTEEQI